LEVKSDAFLISNPNADKLKTRVRLALEQPNPLRLIAKARDVTTDHDRAFLSARIFTDLRPIFDKNATVISASSVVHTLAIHHHQNENHKDFYVALDDNDVETMIEVLQRAKQKSLLLRQLADKAAITYISP
jgi:hypothetical protein